MKVSPIFSALSIAGLLLVSTAANADPAGEWRVQDGTATIRIRKCGNAYCGYIASTASAPGKDVKKPDPRKRNRSVLGMETLINMRPAGENLWAGTKGYYSLEDMVGLWIAEKKHFRDGVFPDNSNTRRLEDIAHYTQVMWRTSTDVGCAVAHGRYDDFLVCRYSEGGNVLGERPF